MLSDEAMALVDTTEEGGDFRKRLLEVLGEHHQKEHDGVFTSWGYAERALTSKRYIRRGNVLLRPLQRPGGAGGTKGIF